VHNGTLGDPTRSELVGFPGGVDLIAVYGGWLHTFLGVALCRLFDLAPHLGYSGALALLLVATGVGGVALGRAMGLSQGAAALMGLLLQLDGWVLYNAMDGRPEHAGFGPFCLALAGLLWTLRGNQRWAPVLGGLAGALTFVSGWEQGVYLGGAGLVVLAGAAWQGGLVADWGRRLGALVVVGAAAAAPWVGLFLWRSLAVRAADEGAALLDHAADQSLLLGAWLLGMGRQPTRLALVAMLALPWALPKERRLLAAVGVGLLLSLLLAIGPTPGLWSRGDLGIWGPQAHLQGLPILGWFHSPARLALGFSFVSVLAAAALVDRLWSGGRRALAGGLAALIVASAIWEDEKAGDWPRGGFALPDWPEVREVGARPGAGAVLDLPISHLGVHTQDNQLTQLLHGRPIPGHPWLPWMAPDRSEEAVAGVALLQWVSEGEGAAPVFTASDRQTLLDRGLRFVAVTPRYVRRGRAGEVVAALTAAWGPPITGKPQRWICWDLQQRGG
jgi:hypothetical protein